MRKRWWFTQPHIRAKILGTILMFVGTGLLVIQTSLSIKLGFSCLLIGLFTIVMITEKTIPEKIGNAQIKGHMNAFHQLTKQLHLKGTAVFLPPNQIRSEERVFIPLKNHQVMLPEIDDEMVFSTGVNGSSMGVVLPPSGLHLLREIEKEIDFSENDATHLDEQLNTFVGMNLLSSIKLSEHENTWQVSIEKPLYCTNAIDLCRQYPCPACSAVLSAITKATDQPLQIDDVHQQGKKTIFHFHMKR